ncbi:hypothetical protein [Jhaorihella thermophila]|uniref:Uncharacterized protein n=1 Tax=Jhaorihella thermophila TaxID=488547 RepID=A0A1H5V332_9RHOB|nr:hypothetical protein [Jhaorihella thermophila]SEF81805.1 hypothetical protein SAMN05421751_105126 [Jhaorihella thermophila]
MTTGRWIALAILLCAGAVLAEPALRALHMWPAGLTGGPAGPLWGIFAGAAIWAQTNALGWPNRRRNAARLDETPSVARLRLTFFFAAATSLGITVLVAIQEDLVPALARPGGTIWVNPAMIATIIGLGTLFPTTASGLFLPCGDERFRAVQQQAQALTLRAAMIAGLAGAAIATYSAAFPPAPVLLYAMAGFMWTTYSGLLWRLEARA